jgi:hypothetical protein
MFFGEFRPGFPSATLTLFFFAYHIIYTDPGYGTLIWQLLLAAFFGGMFYVRRFKDFLRRRRHSDRES